MFSYSMYFYSVSVAPLVEYDSLIIHTHTEHSGYLTNGMDTKYVILLYRDRDTGDWMMDLHTTHLTY